MNRLGALIANKVLDYRRILRDGQKIVIIESDDWGSIRTSNISYFKRLKDIGYPVSNSPYMMDAVETEEDLEGLFNVLFDNETSSKQVPKFTANIITSNPNFQKIKECDFTSYYSETVSDRDKRLGLNLVNKWNEGKVKDLFIPEFHAREHINVPLWLSDLRNKDYEALLTFDMEMCGLPKSVSLRGQSYFTHVYDDKADVKTLISEGIEQFYSLFGVYPKSSIAPNVTWNDSVEKELRRYGITSIQSGKVQREIRKNKFVFTPHFTGEMNSYEQIYSVRNVTFEPSRSGDLDYWKKSFAQVQSMLMQGRPAIISTHRVNYVGSISTTNRDNSLDQLNRLLSAINEAYPDVQYMSTSQFEKVIRSLNYGRNI